MKKVTRILALAMAAAMLCAMLCACENSEEKMAELSGTWMMIEQDSQEQATALLENIDLYEGEIAVVDVNSLQYAWIYEFDTEGNFRQAEDPDKAKELVREFYTGAFEDLYAHRADIDDLYEVEMADMTEDAFYAFYAELYGYDTFEELLTRFVDSAYRYDEWTDLQSGTYSVRGGYITLTTEEGAGKIGYKIEGDTLTLTYSDGVEVYTKTK